jgi:N-hydroxyarylamine O-acetyltransferase
MLTVPFENLDIPLNQKIILSLPSLYEKIVLRKRGGFCYELNGLFNWLLEQIGFEVTLHSARVSTNGNEGPEFDHLVLLVHLETTWLADVGFGDLFLEPLQLDVNPSPKQQGKQFILSQKGGIWTLRKHHPGSNWEPQYSFSLVPRRLPDFEEMCEYHQTSPDSSFTQKRLCTIATENGRITLSELKLITTDGGESEELELKSGDQYRQVLKDLFGVEANGIERLFHEIEF